MKNSTAHFNQELMKMYKSKVTEAESLKRENQELKQLVDNLEKEQTSLSIPSYPPPVNFYEVGSKINEGNDFDFNEIKEEDLPF